jgi:hypothetical protein
MRNTSITTDTAAVARAQAPSPTVGAGRQARNLNPPFDARMLSTGGANPALKNRPLKRGRIIRATGVGYQVNFMFNPSVLDVTFTWDQSLADAAKTDQSAGSPTASTVGEGQLSLNLLFDRTYEINGFKLTLAGAFGVHSDVLAFYQFLGMIDPDISATSSWEQLYPKNQIQQQYAYLYIGDRLKYYGYISSFAVSYTHWSYTMIPMRAAIGIAFNVVTALPTTTPTNTSTTNPRKLPDQKSDPTLGGLVP